MAVSGRKISDFNFSVSRSSAEDSEHKCDPCSTTGQNFEAHGFCVDCQEYLCKTCFECHLKTKASRNHQLVESDKIDVKKIAFKNTEECTEICQVHKKETIKFFCVNHEALGCNDCMTMQHRTCTLDYIPNKCAGIGDSKEYREVEDKLKRYLNEAKALTDAAVARTKAIESCYADIIEEITKFRQEINERLDRLQEKIFKDVNNMMTKDKQKVEVVIDGCNDIVTDIKKLQSVLNDQKTADQNWQLYMTIKRAQSDLKSSELTKNKMALNETDVQHKFERNSELQAILRQEILGKMKRYPTVNRKGEIGENKPGAKLCTVTKWSDFHGLGFHLHAEMGKVGQYIGKVEDDSPAQAAGLVEGDRVIEVEGVNIASENHNRVIKRIKAAGDSVTLLLVDSESDKLYQEKKIVVSSKMPGLCRMGNSRHRSANRKD